MSPEEFFKSLEEAPAVDEPQIGEGPDDENSEDEPDEEDEDDGEEGK